MPESNQATGEEPQGPVIEVDLGEPDPNKAVSRSEAAPRVKDQVRDQNGHDDEDSKLNDWARKSRAVQKRVARMERSFEQKLADQEAKHQRELTSLREDMERRTSVRDERSGGTDDAAHEAKIADLQRQIEAAAEKGDSGQQARLIAQMTREEAIYQAKKSAAAGIAVDARARADTRTERQPAASTTDTPPKAKGPTAAGARFINANEEWWEDEDYAIEREAAGRIFIKLRDEESMDPNDDATYAEVARQLRSKFPKLKAIGGKKKRVESDEDDELVEDRRPPVVSHQDRGAPASERTRSNRRTLSSDEVTTMRQSGLDPNNNRHVVQFLREAQNLEGLR